MITKQKKEVFTDSAGVSHGSLIDAQTAEIVKLFSGNTSGYSVEAILDKKDELIEILTTTATSKNKARKINGGTKKRTPKATVETPTEAK